MKTKRLWLRGKISLSWRDALLTLLVLGIASALSLALRSPGGGDQYVPLIFVLAVLVISRTTDGYLYGIVSSLAAVVGVNWAFTYPYFALNFTLSGYPLTFVTMLAVSLITCTLTTRLKEQERLRRESERETLRANLLRAISHDLRTPLTSIEGSVNAVLENGDVLTREQQTQLLAESRDSARWLIRMVENLLSVTRIGNDAAGPSLRKEPELVEEIVGEALGKFRRSDPGVEVTADIPDEPLLVPMDAMLVEQVLMNLMENAARHGETTSRIELTVRQENGEGVFEVRDNGRGVDEAALPALFAGYPRSDRDTHGDTRGMGIGLSVCSSIIAAHGGRLTGGNRTDGPGAIFRFTLPLE